MSDAQTLIADGFLVGCFPTIAMILATFLLTQVEVHFLIEAALQNFAAGLILAAVAAELFPVMVTSDPAPSYAGVTGGFVLGLSLIYGVEMLVEYIEETPEEELFGAAGDDGKPRSHSIVKTYPQGFEPVPSGDGGHESQQFIELQPAWEEGDVELASRAIENQSHRSHITEHLNELLTIIKSIEEKSIAMSAEGTVVREQEEYAEQIDEAIHSLQYKVDHTRRLLQGSEAAENPLSSLLNGERKANIEKNISGLRLIVEHLVEHINEPVLDKDVIREMRVHMDQMDKQISLFHETIETTAARWHRSLPKIETNEGDTVPMGLVMPVCLDGFVDGFLIGISSVISIKAGIILSFANCLEMSFLGMAYSARLKKCTGSSLPARIVALYSPPLIMFIASGVGAALGSAVQNLPALFIGMVAFGAVALLFLVTNELLIEARNAQGEEDHWFISIMIFVGIYLVLMLDHVL